MYPTSSAGLNRETDTAVYFFTVAFEPLNNYSAHTVRIWDKTFPTAEHAFQWKKFSVEHPEIAQRIFEAGSPEAVKKISDANRDKAPVTWLEDKVAIMEQILQAKAEQHEDVREALSRAGDRLIVENSPVDSFWGDGPDGNGENMIGKIWMRIRKTILIS
ncbi:MAG: NADAR family protein [Patescibacteria group bacterium]